MSEAAVEPWDGVPRLHLTSDDLLRLYVGVPQWHGIALGPPIPFGGGKLAHVEVAGIFRETREEATEVMYINMRAMCEEQGLPYNEDDWRIVTLDLLNGC